MKKLALFAATLLVAGPAVAQGVDTGIETNEGDRPTLWKNAPTPDQPPGVDPTPTSSIGSGDMLDSIESGGGNMLDRIFGNDDDQTMTENQSGAATPQSPEPAQN
jgi:hypothetical protein